MQLIRIAVGYGLRFIAETKTKGNRKKEVEPNLFEYSNLITPSGYCLVSYEAKLITLFFVQKKRTFFFLSDQMYNSFAKIF